MNKLTKEGIIFSVIVLIVFAAIDITQQSSIRDATVKGFPLTYYSQGAKPGCTPQTCPATENTVNFVLNIGLGLALGFGVSYIKSSVMKK